MTRRSSAVERCEKELKAMGVSIEFRQIGPLSENEERILDCFSKLSKSLTISELNELECLLYYLRKYWEEIGG